MSNNEQYKSLFNEIIAKQSVILGPDIALLKARNVGGLSIGESGKVESISGDPKAAMQQLIDEYVNLSGAIVKSALTSVFDKYPDLK
jgi:hypothetical protein